jgi:hypothetical protein
VLHLTLGHCRARAAILLFELIGGEVALASPVSFVASTLIGGFVFAYARINTDLTSCNVDTSEPDGAGLRRKSGN